MERHRGTYPNGGDRCTCGEWRKSKVHYICDNVGHEWEWDGTCGVCGMGRK